MAATWKPAPPQEAREASRTEWFAWGSAFVAGLLLLVGAVQLWQLDDVQPMLGVTEPGHAFALMGLGIAATVVSAAAFVIAAVSRRP